MTRKYAVGRVTSVALVFVCMVASTRVIDGRQQPGQKVLPVKVDVVLSRFQGEKKVSSLPFTLWVNVGNRESLRMGVDVPIGSVTSTRTNSSPNQTSSTASTSTQTEYRNVGTQIDCTVSPIVDDPRFWINLSIQDSSIYSADSEGRSAIKVSDLLAFRTFSMSNTLAMRDGQTLQYTMATDKISGEVLKVDVTINVVK